MVSPDGWMVLTDSGLVIGFGFGRNVEANHAAAQRAIRHT